MKSAWTLKREGKVARLIFDLPDSKVNTFTPESLLELEEKLNEVGAVDFLTIESAKRDSFIAGADLKQFEKFLQEKEGTERVIESGHRVFNKLSQFPSVAVIDGTCLGGGLELALACRYRIVTDNPKVKIGLPETTLGIIPGWGGTQRLPRLIGLEQGLNMILTGKQIDGKKALKSGLADLALTSAFLEEELIKALPKLKKREKKTTFRSLLLEKNPVGRKILFHLARKEVKKKTKGFYPAPLVACDLIEKTATLPLSKGLDEEKRVFLQERDKAFSIAPHLIHLFFAVEHLKKQGGEGAKEIDSVGVVGSGLMGGGIAWASALSGLDVLMTDVNWEVVNRGLGEILKMFKDVAKRKRLTHDAINLMMHRIGTRTDNRGFIQQQFVVEAATENLDLKRKIFRDIEETVSNDVIIASNTSSLKLSEMSKEMKHPERFVGLHFFNPVNRMPLVEVVKGEKTRPEVVAAAVSLCKKLNKVPLVVNDCSGFLVNRLFAVQAVELMRIYMEGAKAEQLERVMTAFGWPMGPFTLADQVGLDTCSKVFHLMNEAYGERMSAPNLIDDLVKSGALGKKSGRGFFIYDGKKKHFNPDFLKIPQGNCTFTDEEIVNRANSVMINEAALCLEEGIVASEEDVDAASVLGIGFPPFRGGLMRYARERGFDKIVKELARPASYLKKQ